jgi:polar amino acid transport system substrate-binding protein
MEVKMPTRVTTTLIAASIALAGATTAVFAGPLQDRIDAGEPIRIGFANIPIWAYPDDAGEPDGFMNDVAIQTLANMGYTNIEAVVTDWGGLIPGLQAERYDMITGGMYILNSRCENVSFSEPVGVFSDAFIVPAGNPKNLHNYQDVLDAGGVLVTGAGYNTVEAAKREGFTDANLMQVPGVTEIKAAVEAGRADAGVLTYFEAAHVAHESGGKIDLGDVSKLPEWTKNWAGIGFRHEDKDFLEKFNPALQAYIGTDEMLAMVAEHEYTTDHLPGDKTAEWACANR